MKKIINMTLASVLLTLALSISALAGDTPITNFTGDTPITNLTGDTPITNVKAPDNGNFLTDFLKFMNLI